MELSPEEHQRIYAEEKARLEAQQQLSAEQGAQRGKWVFGCLAAIAGLILAIVVIASFSKTDKPAALGRDDSGAQVMAEHFVKKRLLAPATADFGGETVEYLGGTKHKVTGLVDAQNAFGAKLRKRFVCTVEKTGPDQWTASEPCGLLE
jgi:hypothetical protein